MRIPAFVRFVYGFLLLSAVSASSYVLPMQAQQQEPGVNPALLDGPWTAQWIAHPTASGTDFGVFHFRRAFDLAERPDSFIVHVSADNRYRLFVNGTPVAAGPARGDLMHWRFETLDLAPQLQAGRNVLAAVVWNFAEHRPQAQFTYRTALIVQGDTEHEAAVNTDETWIVTQNEGYASKPVTRAMVGGAYIVVGPGEEIDGARYPWGWETLDFDDGDWLAAREVRVAKQEWGPNYGEFSGWRLVPRDIPMMEERSQRIPRLARAHGVSVPDGFLQGNAPLTIPPHTQATLLLDQTHLTTAYPELVASDGAGSRITLTYAEALVDSAGQKGHRDVIEGKSIRGIQDAFLPDGGSRRLFRPLWWRTYRYVQIDIQTAEAPLTIHDVLGQFTAYPFEERAFFAADDTLLASIWDVGWRTARLCAGETYFDCPYYEQLQYVGDTRIQALISLYVSGDDRLMRKAIHLFDTSRIPSGLTQSRYPAHGTQFIPPYSLFWIAMVHDYWMHRDDPAFVASFLNGVRGVVDWYAARIDSTGMVGSAPWWNFVDWSFQRGVPPGADEGHAAIISLQLVYALDQAAELASGFGRSDEADYYRALAEDVKAATYRQCWNAERGLLADTPEQQSFSQHANAFALLVDLIPDADQVAFMQRVLTEDDLTPVSYYFRFYLDGAMKRAGLAETYVDRLDAWRTMLDLGLTTFAENPEPTRSDAHAWSASPNYHFLETVCGIEPAAPGFKAVRIVPALGSLQHVECRMPHPLGEITVVLRRTGEDGLEGAITLPEGLSGVVIWIGDEKPLGGGEQPVQF